MKRPRRSPAKGKSGPVEGIHAGSKLKGAVGLPPRVSRTVFVSRFATETAAKDVADALAAVDVRDCLVSRMKTRYESYTSFHIRVNVEVLEKVLASAMWPVGSIVKMFLGKLFDEKVVEIEYRGHFVSRQLQHWLDSPTVRRLFLLPTVLLIAKKKNQCSNHWIILGLLKRVKNSQLDYFNFDITSG